MYDILLTREQLEFLNSLPRTDDNDLAEKLRSLGLVQQQEDKRNPVVDNWGNLTGNYHLSDIFELTKGRKGICYVQKKGMGDSFA